MRSLNSNNVSCLDKIKYRINDKECFLLIVETSESVTISGEVSEDFKSVVTVRDLSQDKVFKINYFNFGFKGVYIENLKGLKTLDIIDIELDNRLRDFLLKIVSDENINKFKGEYLETVKQLKSEYLGG